MWSLSKYIGSSNWILLGETWSGVLETVLYFHSISFLRLKCFELRGPHSLLWSEHFLAFLPFFIAGRIACLGQHFLPVGERVSLSVSLLMKCPMGNLSPTLVVGTFKEQIENHLLAPTSHCCQDLNKGRALLPTLHVRQGTTLYFSESQRRSCGCELTRAYPFQVSLVRDDFCTFCGLFQILNLSIYLFR